MARAQNRTLPREQPYDMALFRFTPTFTRTHQPEPTIGFTSTMNAPAEVFYYIETFITRAPFTSVLRLSQEPQSTSAPYVNILLLTKELLNTHRFLILISHHYQQQTWQATNA